jgi:hypothetical protein
VLDFGDVEAHGRYVAAFADNKPPVRGGRHVMHADETLAMHAGGMMTRLYNKGRESLVPAAQGRTRFEFERKRPRLRKAGVSVVRDLELRRLDREARQMFEDCGYDRDVAPVSEWVWRLMSTVPTYPLCTFCASEDESYEVVDFDLDFAVESGSWQAASFRDVRVNCQDPDRCGQAMPGFSTATKRGALAHAVLTRIGVDPQTHRNTERAYKLLYDEAGVVPASIELFDQGDDADVVFLDLESQTERRRKRAS